MGNGCSAEDQRRASLSSNPGHGNPHRSAGGSSALVAAAQDRPGGPVVASGRPKKTLNPFRDAAKHNPLRRVRHKVLVERAYQNRAPSPALVESLNAAFAPCAQTPQPLKALPLAGLVPNPLDEVLPLPVEDATLEHSISIVDNTADDDTPPPMMPAALTTSGDAPQVPSNRSSFSRRRQQRQLHPHLQAYVDTCRDIRALLHLCKDEHTVTFVMAQHADSSYGSVHGQLAVQGCSSGSVVPSATAILQNRQSLASILVHRDPTPQEPQPLLSPTDEAMALLGLPVGGEAPSDQSTGSQAVAGVSVSSVALMSHSSIKNLSRRTMHVSPKCIGYLTEEAQRGIMGGKKDNAHFWEDIRFVRDDT